MNSTKVSSISILILIICQISSTLGFDAIHAKTLPCSVKNFRSSSSSYKYNDGRDSKRILGSSRETQKMMSSRTSSWPDDIGASALNQVQNLARVAQRANDKGSIPIRDDDDSSTDSGKGRYSATGNTAPVFTDMTEQSGIKGQNRQVVLSALESLERDMQLLDNIAGENPQLSSLELLLLSLSVAAASSGPVLFAGGGRVAEVIAPASAAFSAAIGIGAEFTGKVAVADGKEVAAATMQCAAEAEGLLAKAERAKAILPLCVGIGATAASFSILAPVLIESLDIGKSLQVATELFLFCPLVAVLAASVASLSLQETRSFSSRAISIGNRRFAKSGLVGRTWLSSSEQIEQNSQRSRDRWTNFVISVIPAPIVGALVPGILATKAVVVAAVAAAQTAYFLTLAESALARATDAVALKSRSAAVCDTYANQGARSAAILPFTSALSSLCAAATAAIVELPWLEALGQIGGAGGVISQVGLVSIFPAMSSLFAAAASVSKARCEVDAEAAIQAASTLALEYDDGDDPVLDPFRGVMELVRLSLSTGWKSFKKTRIAQFVRPFVFTLKRAFQRRR